MVIEASSTNGISIYAPRGSWSSNRGHRACRYVSRKNPSSPRRLHVASHPPSVVLTAAPLQSSLCNDRAASRAHGPPPRAGLQSQAAVEAESLWVSTKRSLTSELLQLGIDLLE